MPNVVPQEFRDTAYPQETGEAYIVLLTIDHPSLSEPIRLTNGHGAWNESIGWYVLSLGSGEDYICGEFEVIPPGESDEEPHGKLRVQNVDQRIGEAIESIDGPAFISLSVVLQSDPTILIGDPFQELRLQNVQGDAMEITGDLLWPQISTEQWPADTISVRKFLAARRALS